MQQLRAISLQSGLLRVSLSSRHFQFSQSNMVKDAQSQSVHHEATYLLALQPPPKRNPSSYSFLLRPTLCRRTDASALDDITMSSLQEQKIKNKSRMGLCNRYVDRPDTLVFFVLFFVRKHPKVLQGRWMWKELEPHFGGFLFLISNKSIQNAPPCVLAMST